MKRIRVFALLTVLGAFAAPAAHAQGGGGGQGRGGNRMEMLMQGITLTDAQKTSVDSIVTASRAQMPPIRTTASRVMTTLGKFRLPSSFQTGNAPVS